MNSMIVRASSVSSAFVATRPLLPAAQPLVRASANTLQRQQQRSFRIFFRSSQAQIEELEKKYSQNTIPTVSKSIDPQQIQITRPADHYTLKNTVETTPQNPGFVYTPELLKQLDNISYTTHLEPQCQSDRIALGLVRFLRVFADLFFRKRYLHRAVVLETVAAVPGMVGGVIRHLRSLRRMKRDHGWIMKLLEEAENERMHLLTWIKVCRPTLLERLLVIGTQAVFFNAFFMLYTVSPKTAHRFVGYLEEEACRTYTKMLADIDAGLIPNGPAPLIAKGYWNLHADATIRDVALVIRADESLHRDCNHELAFKAARKEENN